MNSAQDDSYKTQRNIYLLPLVLILLLLVVIAWIFYHFKDEKRFTVIRLYGETAAYNFSKDYGLAAFPSSKKRNGALLAEEGDLLAFENSFIYLNTVSNDSLRFDETGDSLVLINGKINSILIKDSTELLPWFKKMKAEDVSDLESIFFTSIVPVSYIPFLKEIARLKPTIALGFDEGDSSEILDSYIKLADFFAPRFVYASITQDQFPLLARWKTAECIYLSIIDSAVTTSLPAMPLLNQCILSGTKKNIIGASFFSNNKQIKRISLIDNSRNLLLLQPLENLQELSIYNNNDSLDIKDLKNKLPGLSVLILPGYCNNIDLLASCKKMKWLGLPENTSQLLFDKITTELNELQIMEFRGSDSIKKFAALHQLPNLRGLVIADTVTDKESLYALTELRYLSVPDENEEDSSYIISLEKALPGCIIVPNTGFCLGSGWLLLLLPLLLIFRLIYQNKLLRNVFHKNSPGEIS